MKRLLLALSLLASAGCVSYPGGPSRPVPAAGEDLPASIRVHLTHHPPRVLDAPVVTPDSITGFLDGTGIRWGAPLSDVVGVDHPRVSVGRTILLGVVSTYLALVLVSVAQYASGGYS